MRLLEWSCIPFSKRLEISSPNGVRLARVLFYGSFCDACISWSKKRNADYYTKQCIRTFYVPPVLVQLLFVGPLAAARRFSKMHRLYGCFLALFFVIRGRFSPSGHGLLRMHFQTLIGPHPFQLSTFVRSEHFAGAVNRPLSTDHCRGLKRVVARKVC